MKGKNRRNRREWIKFCMKSVRETNNFRMKPEKKGMKKRKKKSQIQSWFREFKRKSKNNKDYNYKEKFKKESIF